jgi:putative ABC transport system permease protein
VGVVADFNTESVHSKIQPTIIRALTDMTYGSMLIRVKPGYEKQVLGKLNAVYKSFYPDKPFSYAWVNELVDQQYQTEYKLQQLFTCFSALIIFLACLGLFGLVSFSTEQRVKEIGIRKVLGANVSDIVALVSREYIWLVTIAVLVASPIAWYAMSKWLQDFAYRINIQWWVFVVTGIAALLIALITVSFQSIKAALANPVKSLRSE